MNDALPTFEIPSHLTLVPGEGGLTKAVIQTPWSTAEIYLHGAHVTAFQKKGEPPLLFLSADSQFIPGKAIRGGVPLIFPWFGGREGHPAHGFARTVEWQLTESLKNADGSITLRLQLPDGLHPCRVQYLITVGEALTLTITVENLSAEAVTFENCLHTYFTIGSIHDVSVTGLQGTDFIDQLDGNSVKTETAAAIRFHEETDRIYTNSPAALEIHDPTLGRTIHLTTTGVRSTVVWNPWIEKSQRMADFGNEEYLQMVCVESGNVASNKIHLAPAAQHATQLILGSLMLSLSN